MEEDAVTMDDVREALEAALVYIVGVDHEYSTTGGKRGEPLDDEIALLRRALSLWAQG